MNTKELKEKLKNEKNVKLIFEIEYGSKKYVKTFKRDKEGISYFFYEIDGDKIIDITDTKTLKYLEENYNINDKVMY